MDFSFYLTAARLFMLPTPDLLDGPFIQSSICL